MKPLPTKAQIRDEMEQQRRDFLASGGLIVNIAQGVSGRLDGSSINPRPFIEHNRDSRTPVSDVVASIEARKGSKSAAATSRLRKRPHKKMLYDDFGEPLRWVWSEE
ncbi:MAG: hypothetical protein V7707_11035 [Motiliproteus sp.]